MDVSGLAKGRYRLSNMKLDFVSLVAAGDDPLAEVVISKAAPEGRDMYAPAPLKRGRCADCGGKVENGKCKKCGYTVKKTSNDPQEGNMGDQIAKNDLDPEVVAYIEGLEAEVDTLSKSVEDMQAETEELRSTLAKSAPKDEEAAQDITKALLAKADPAVRALFEQQQAELSKAADIAKAEREARLQREYISKAEALPMINDGTEDLAGLLRRAADRLEPKDVEKFEQVLKAANEQIAQGSLFDTLGSGGAETTISKSITAMAEEIRKSNPSLTMDQAQAQVYETHPDLFQQAMTGQEG